MTHVIGRFTRAAESCNIRCLRLYVMHIDASVFSTDRVAFISADFSQESSTNSVHVTYVAPPPHSPLTPLRNPIARAATGSWTGSSNTKRPACTRRTASSIQIFSSMDVARLLTQWAPDPPCWSPYCSLWRIDRSSSKQAPQLHRSPAGTCPFGSCPRTLRPLASAACASGQARPGLALLAYRARLSARRAGASCARTSAPSCSCQRAHP